MLHRSAHARWAAHLIVAERKPSNDSAAGHVHGILEYPEVLTMPWQRHPTIRLVDGRAILHSPDKKVNVHSFPDAEIILLIFPHAYIWLDING